jgi:hypothetical protein
MKLDWGKILTSKTIWLGAIMIVAGISEYIASLPAGTSIAQIVFGMSTIIVRLLTKDAVTK